MASTAEGATLTEAHRLAQVQLKTVITGQLSSMWDRFDIENPFRSWNLIEPDAVRLIRNGNRLSTRLSSRYFEEFHRAERARGASRIRLAPLPDPDDLVPNLRLVGPVWAERNRNAGVTFSNLASEITRQVLNGGRSTLTGSVEATPSCLGYYRVSDGSPCAFCALLIGRGAVYSSETGDFEAHRGCGCTAEPLYRDSQPAPNSDIVAAYDDIYDSIPSDVTGADRIAEFRRRYQAAQT